MSDEMSKIAEAMNDCDEVEYEYYCIEQPRMELWINNVCLDVSLLEKIVIRMDDDQDVRIKFASDRGIVFVEPGDIG